QPREPGAHHGYVNIYGGGARAPLDCGHILTRRPGSQRQFAFFADPSAAERALVLFPNLTAGSHGRLPGVNAGPGAASPRRGTAARLRVPRYPVRKPNGADIETPVMSTAAIYRAP